MPNSSLKMLPWLHLINFHKMCFQHLNAFYVNRKSWHEQFSWYIRSMYFSSTQNICFISPQVPPSTYFEYERLKILKWNLSTSEVNWMLLCAMIFELLGGEKVISNIFERFVWKAHEMNFIEYSLLKFNLILQKDSQGFLKHS